MNFALLVPAIALTRAANEHRQRSAERATRAARSSIAAVSLLLWVGVVLAGRWIAFADYLFPE